jgi:DNA-binding MarR family transcriptional regulator
MTARTPALADATQVANDLRIVLGRIVRRLRQGHEAGELTLSELSVLSRLDRHGSSPAGVLAEHERISPQAMTTILAALEARELAVRDADTRDGRRVNMSATSSGKRLLAGRRSRNAQRMAHALDEALTVAERQQLLAAVPLLEWLAERL